MASPLDFDARPKPTLDTSRLPPTSRPLPTADAAAYDASPEGRATARQFAQEKFTQAGGGSKYVPPNPAAGPTGAAPKPAMPSTGGIRRAGEALKRGATSLAKNPRATLTYGAGNLTAKAVKGSPLALGAHAVSHFNDYKIDDPDVDSSAAGALAAITKGDFAGAGRSLSKGALEALMDLGSAGANLLDYVAPGKAPVSSAYDRMLRSTFGDLLVPHQSVLEATGQAPTAAATPAPTAAAAPAPTAAAAPAPAPIPTADPNIGPHPDLTKDLAKVPDLSKNPPAGLREGAVYKTKDANGRTVYSGVNVKQDADMIDGRGKPVGSLRDAYGPSSVQPAAQEQYFVQPTAAQPGAPAQQPAAQGQAPAQPAAAAAQPAAAQPAAAQPAAAQPAGPSLDFDTSRGAVSTLPAGISPFASSFGLGGSDAAISQARQAAADRGDFDAVAASYGGGGQPSGTVTGGGGHASLSHGTLVGSNAEKFSRQVARSNAESAAMAAVKSGSVRERGRGMATLAQLAGGDQDATTSRYNTDAQSAASRYTSDNSLRGQVYSADAQSDSSRYTADMGLRSAYAKNMPAQAQRQAQAMAMQMAGNDIPTAIKILARMGYSAEGLASSQSALNSDQTTQQNLSEGARKNAVARFGQFMQTDKDGKPVAGAEGALLNSMESIVPGSTQMREDQLAAPVDLGRGVVMSGQAAVTAGLNILKGLNTTKDNAFLQSIGWDPANPRLDQLPDLNGAKLDRVGWAKGKAKGGNVESGNYQLDLGGGRVLYLPHDQIGENELALLRARGVNIPK